VAKLVGVEHPIERYQALATGCGLDDGWFRVLTWSIPGGNTGVWAGLATYDADYSRVDELKALAEEALRTLFPS
jgi:hypothetical protein